MSAMPLFRSWSRKRKRILAVTVLVIAALAVALLPLPLGPGTSAEAARLLVAWALEGKRIRGLAPDYPFPRPLQGVARVYIVCDLVRPDVALSTDPRVQRLSIG